MSVEGFNIQRKRIRKHNSDIICIHYDPDKYYFEDVIHFIESIQNIKERNHGTLFTIEPEGMYFRRV